jgi:sugar transferase (PEP-CTERM/EpsH1 system associated)
VKILFLTPVLPHEVRDGDRLRLHHFLRGLSSRHRLVLAGFCDGEGELRQAQASPLGAWVESLHGVPLSRGRRVWNAALTAFSGTPFNLSSMRSRRMRSLVSSLLAGGDFDAVYCYRLKMAPYALLASCPKALDFTDSLGSYFSRRTSGAGPGVRSLLWRWEARRLKEWEASLARSFQACFANSVEDAASLTRDSGVPVEVLPNGVDLGHFHPAKTARRPHSLVFVGNMVYPPNVEAVLSFARDCLPWLKRRYPDLSLTVVGGNPVPSVRILARDPAIEVTGPVEDTRPFVWRSQVSICPVSLGAGRQNKVLEAFALGTPVAASGLAARGVEAQDGKQLLVAQGAQAFCLAVARLLDEPKLSARLARNALAFVRRRYDWKKSAKLIESRLQALVKKKFKD